MKPQQQTPLSPDKTDMALNDLRLVSTDIPDKPNTSIMSTVDKEELVQKAKLAEQSER